MQQRSTFNKREKLKSRKRIELLFRQGKSFSVFPYRVYFLVEPVGAYASTETASSGPVVDPTPGGLTTLAAPTDPPPTAPAAPEAGDVKPASAVAQGGPTPIQASTDPPPPTPLAAPEAPDSGPAPRAAIQAGFGAGSRHFKKAVDRNRIKRLGREAYRLQKAPLLSQLTEKKLRMDVFFIYTGKELPDYQLVSEKIGVVLQKLLKETA